MLDENVYITGTIFFVLVDDDDRLCIVWNHLIDNRLYHIGILDGTEELLNLCLCPFDINVAHNNDSLIGGMIPFLIIVAQLLRLEVVHHAHQTDGIAKTVLAARIESWKVSLEHTTAGRCAHAPLFVNHATLLVNLCRVENQSVSPVVENEQTTVKHSHACCRHIADTIDGLVD